MLFLAHALAITKSDTGLFLVALLSSFNPIMAHVTTKFWLDAPLLAFATLGSALFLHSLKKKNLAIAVAAGIVVGYASLIKLTAFLIVPGIFLVCIATLRPLKWKTFLAHALCFAIPAVIVQTPWEIWQWMAVGSPFPQWPSKPSETLLRSNRYVYFVTVVRSPWTYLTTTPMVVTTIIPSVALLLLSYVRKEDDGNANSGAAHLSTSYVRAAASACLLWMSIVIAFNMALGFAGYSILLRYIILLTPASVLLPSLLVPHCMELRSHEGLFASKFGLFLLVCSAVGILAEVATGINAALHVQRALIVPFTGL
jgi:4-amino-4-deoxy-L-arabinose transferase-like glycosyltransferase